MDFWGGSVERSLHAALCTLDGQSLGIGINVGKIDLCT